MSTYTPDCWAVVKLPDDVYKVFASWQGGFTTGDSWKLNSGITSVAVEGSIYSVKGYSGSVYRLNKNNYRLTAYMASQASYFKTLTGKFEVLSKEDSIAVLEKFVKEEQ